MNVVGRRAGSSRRQVVIVAARDAAHGSRRARQRRRHRRAHADRPRLPGPRRPRRRSCSPRWTGRTSGEVGARQLVEALPTPDFVDAVLVISDLGAPARGRPGARRRGRTTTPRAGDRASAHAGGVACARSWAAHAGGSGTLGQLARLVVPARRSARRACSWRRATTRSGSPGAASCRPRGRPAGGARPGPPRRARPRARSARCPRSTRAPARARAGELPARP